MVGYAPTCGSLFKTGCTDLVRFNFGILDRKQTKILIPLVSTFSIVFETKKNYLSLFMTPKPPTKNQRPDGLHFYFKRRREQVFYLQIS